MYDSAQRRGYNSFCAMMNPVVANLAARSTPVAYRAMRYKSNEGSAVSPESPHVGLRLQRL